MNNYFYFWILFITFRALYCGYGAYQEYLKAGYNTDHFRKTGQKIEFHGGTGEAISCTVAGALGLLVSPVFLFIESVKFIPVVAVLYLLSK